MELTPGLEVADRFVLERLLGQGGMGAVWVALHKELQVKCAIKFIEATFASNQEFRMRFVREAQAAAKIRSPHVVAVLDAGVWNGLPYIAMELMEGQDLGHRLTQAGRLPPAETVEVIQQTARALTKAHAAGFVHRDLKPDNIFLTRDDDRLLCKVLDFGIAKQLSDTGVDGGTRAGALLGTPYYMSPEQAMGNKSIDHRSDLWSLAVIAYECLVGVKPFDSDGLGELLGKIMGGDIPMPSQTAPWLPPTFENWWRKATTRDPAGRFQSARELADALAVSLNLSAAGFHDGSVVSSDGYAQAQALARGSSGTMVPAVTGVPGMPTQQSAMGTTASGGGSKGAIFAIVGVVVVAASVGGYFALRGSAKEPTSRGGVNMSSGKGEKAPEKTPEKPPEKHPEAPAEKPSSEPGHKGRHPRGNKDDALPGMGH